MTDVQTQQALGAYLKSLRTQAGLDLAVLGRRVSLSAAQLAQLESGQDSLFYNPRIRLQAARKVIAHLGGDLHRLPPEQATAPEAPAPAVAPAAASAPPAAHAPMKPSRTGPSSKVWMAGGLMLSLVLFGLAYVAGPARKQGDAPAQVLAAVPPPAPSSATPEPPSAAPAVSEAPVPEPGPTVATPARVESVASAEQPACGKPSENAPSVTPPQASKPGDMVYVVSQVQQVLCVIDASGKAQLEHLKAGQALSFYGRPPWQVQSAQLQQTQLYFQGWRVRLPADVQDRIQLVELR